MSTKLLKLPVNELGSDWIIGDLHGHLSHLESLLVAINFDRARDRLISVGDLIDRGPRSLETLELFAQEPNFFMVRGNHEQLMMDTIINNDQMAKDCWLNNGGDWIVNAPRQRVADMTEWLTTTPLILTVGEHDNRFNCVHAELVKPGIPISDFMIDEWAFDTYDEYQFIWSRHIYDSYDYWINTLDLRDVDGRFHDAALSTTYCGHTTRLNLPIQYERHCYIDTGAGYFTHRRFDIVHQARLTAVCPTKHLFARCDSHHQVEFSAINTIKQYGVNAHGTPSPS